MKIEIFDGCTDGGIDIDGRNFQDYTEQEIIELFNKLLPSVYPARLDEILKTILNNSDIDYEYKEMDCEQCGDCSRTYIYEV